MDPVVKINVVDEENKNIWRTSARKWIKVHFGKVKAYL